jgi:hypothetical protein
VEDEWGAKGLKKAGSLVFGPAFSIQGQHRGVASPHAAILFCYATKEYAEKRAPLSPPGFAGFPALRSRFGDGKKLASLRQFFRLHPEPSTSLRRVQKGEKGRSKSKKENRRISNQNNRHFK